MVAVGIAVLGGLLVAGIMFVARQSLAIFKHREKDLVRDPIGVDREFRFETQSFRYYVTIDKLNKVRHDAVGIPRDAWTVGINATRKTTEVACSPGLPTLYVNDREYPASGDGKWSVWIPPEETRSAQFLHLLPPGVLPTRLELREAEGEVSAVSM